MGGCVGQRGCLPGGSCAAAKTAMGECSAEGCTSASQGMQPACMQWAEACWGMWSLNAGERQALPSDLQSDAAS